MNSFIISSTVRTVFHITGEERISKYNTSKQRSDILHIFGEIRVRTFEVILKGYVVHSTTLTPYIHLLVPPSQLYRTWSFEIWYKSCFHIAYYIPWSYQWKLRDAILFRATPRCRTRATIFCMHNLGQSETLTLKILSQSGEFCGFSLYED